MVVQNRTWGVLPMRLEKGKIQKTFLRRKK